MLLLGALLSAAGLTAGCYRAYRLAFHADPKREAGAEAVPPGEGYRPYGAQILRYARQLEAAPYEPVEIRSRDGLRLFGRYYPVQAGAPLVILFHGYRSSAVRDGGGGFSVCRARGMNVLIPDLRAHGRSQGSAITFGVKERLDCLDWVQYAVERFGEPVEILLFGLSMGAATVLMAADLPLPENIKGIVADCGYSSPEKILKTVIHQKHLPVFWTYPFARWGARLFGGFDPQAASAAQALRRCRVPVLFFHGQQDDFVPLQMSVENYEACGCEKELVLMAGAAHGMSFYSNPEGYMAVFDRFCRRVFQNDSKDKK